MAVEGPRKKPVSSEPAGGRRILIGANVGLAIVLAAGIVAVLQAIAYSVPNRWDMTSTGVNSLSEGTENLLRNLDTELRLTSLYFETDLEEADQQRYRRAVGDLLGLYASTNRSRVTFAHINPLNDHDEFNALVKRQREKPASKNAVESYVTRIDKYRNELDGMMRDLVERELAQIASFGGGLGGRSTPESISQIEFLFTKWREQLQSAREEVDALITLDDPQYAAVTDRLAALYADLLSALNNVETFSEGVMARSPDLEPGHAQFLREAGGRYDEIGSALESAQSELQALEPLQSDEVLSQIATTGNAILVETDDESLVVDFSSVWPPLNENQMGGRVAFEDRAFKGEEKVTSAILRATHKQQTAVIFVRYGGTPPFTGVPLPNQPPAPYAGVKTQLEDANFIVKDWDLKASTTPPEVDPTPTRTIYVVFKPTPAARGQFGQTDQDIPFGDVQRRAILDALGEAGRALFIAGWAPGPFGPIPSTYEYNDYLKETWGLSIDTSALLIAATETAPGRFNVTSRYFYNMEDFELGEHDIVSGSRVRLLVLPWCAPIDVPPSPPEGVEYHGLLELPYREGIWGVKDIQKYEAQFKERQYLTRDPDDLAGPFDLALAAAKGDAKIVVVSSREFATDVVAFAREFGLGSQGFTIRSRNPGNVTLLVNSLHWLNDNTEFMNVGQPIDVAVLNIPSKAGERAVHVLTVFVWPALALCCGGVAWWVRRR